MDNKINGKEIEDYLADELYDWKDLVIFMADSYLDVLLEDMANKGELPNIDKEGLDLLHEHVEEELHAKLF